MLIKYPVDVEREKAGNCLYTILLIRNENPIIPVQNSHNDNIANIDALACIINPLAERATIAHLRHHYTVILTINEQRNRFNMHTTISKLKNFVSPLRSVFGMQISGSN